MSIQKEAFGTAKSGETIYIYTITNDNGMKVGISTFGAVIHSLLVPDQNKQLEDVVLGYDKLESYFDNAPGFGAVIGRNANRIENAEFTLNGIKYPLLKNDGSNNLHSGPDGFQHGVWEASVCDEGDENGQSVILTYHSKDGEQGFPGNFDIAVTYTLTGDNALILCYKGISDADTIVNMTNHCYFNLSGHNSGTVLQQKVWMDADQFTPTDRFSIPTGELRDVAGTPMDFTVLKPIGKDIQSDYEQIVFGNGFDHNWVLKTTKGQVELVARMEDEVSGRRMEVYTDMPGMQFYTANFLDGTEVGKGNTPYLKNAGACFETQFFPDAVHKPHFPQSVLRALEQYHYTTVYKFL